MKLNVWICVVCLVLSLLIGIKIGWEIHRLPDCPKCPEIVAMELVERDSSIRQPTVTNSVPTASITPTIIYRNVYRNISNTDSGKPALREEKQAINCWDFNALEPDSAIITVHLCSETFSVMPPADLVPKIDYTASPHIRVIERTNNVIQPCPEPLKPKRWGFTVGPYVGYGIDFSGRQNIQVGIGMSWGFRIKVR